ncbi:lactonase family protein [Chitinophaga sp. CB10]|uniref:lactonase family protein n=1 Tax=Chitinophaga sp. CB10 TaxID=1891659 RepID=UPI0025C55213|nr:lactonase family protein [Chitinophaga sp. CB10]
MKRFFLRYATLSAFALLPFGLIYGQQKHKQQHMSDKTSDQPYLLLGTYTNSGQSKGIYVYKFNTQTGEATPVSEAATSNPSYLAVSPDRHFVYAVNEDGGPGSVSSFAFDHASGRLSFINKVPSEGQWPCYVSVSRNGKFIAVANYGSGNAAVFPVSNGSIGAAADRVQHAGTGPVTDRQEKAHAHAAIFSPDNKYLFVNDLGIDKIMCYNFAASTGKLTPATAPFVQVKPGSGPRHLVFDASGKFAYLMTELSGEVLVYAYADGRFTLLQTISSHPADFKGKIGSADIHLSPDGNFLYASNRGDANSLAIFKRDKSSGKLTSIGFQSTLGVMPRNFNFDPGGNFLLAAHQESNDVVIFKVDKKTGLLTDTGKRIKVGSPVCVQWVE